MSVSKTPLPLRIIFNYWPSYLTAIMCINHQAHWPSANIPFSHHTYPPSCLSAITPISHHSYQPSFHQIMLELNFWFTQISADGFFSHKIQEFKPKGLKFTNDAKIIYYPISLIFRTISWNKREGSKMTGFWAKKPLFKIYLGNPWWVLMIFAKNMPPPKNVLSQDSLQ